MRGIGACDPQNITEETLSDLAQPTLIREAIASIAGEAGERHMSKFANAIFTRLTEVKPSIKFRYLKAGIEIVGDHPQAYDARKVFDYYKDLVTEIKLEAKVDGPDVVGHEQPFGAVRQPSPHARDRARIGRVWPISSEPEQFRITFYTTTSAGRWRTIATSFRTVAKQALRGALRGHLGHLPGREGQLEGDERIRLASDAVCLPASEGTEPEDRQGPSAAAGPRLHGHVGLRGFAGRVADDSGRRLARQGAVRPFEKLQLTQTLDERQAAQGKLILEIKAAARGLIPDLDELVSLDQPGFQLEKVDDQGVSVSKFDPDSPATVIDSERTWLVSYRAAAGQARPPASSASPPPRSTRRRYISTLR